MAKNNLGIKQERNEKAFMLKNNQMLYVYYYLLIGINDYLLIKINIILKLPVNKYLLMGINMYAFVSMLWVFKNKTMALSFF